MNCWCINPYLCHPQNSTLNLILEKNPLCPAFSEAAAIGFDPEKGRIVKARRDIKVMYRCIVVKTQDVACFSFAAKVKYDVVQEGNSNLVDGIEKKREIGCLDNFCLISMTS